MARSHKPQAHCYADQVRLRRANRTSVCDFKTIPFTTAGAANWRLRLCVIIYNTSESPCPTHNKYSTSPFANNYYCGQTLAATTVEDSNVETHVIPENTLCMVNFSAAFKNPARCAERKISPERRSELRDSPAIHFDPSRWLEGEDQLESEDTNVLVHWPFGQGPQSYVGRSFAQIEMVANVGTIFRDHSLKLVVDKKTTEACNGDSKLTSMGEDSRRGFEDDDR